jgi:DNA-binding IclR family transcriptional regulator
VRLNDEPAGESAPLAPATADTQRSTANDIQVIERTAAILRLLVTGDTLDVVATARELGIGRSSAHRYLTSMERHGLLARRDRNTYEIGTLMTQLGAAALARSGVIRTARPVVEALRDELKQTIALALWNGATAVIAHVSEDTSRTAHVSVRVGSSLGDEAAQTAVVRAFLEGAAAGEADQDRLARIRRTGVGIRGGHDDGVRAVAVPIMDPSGAIVATLAAVGVAQLIPDTADSPVAHALMRASARVTEALGSSRDQPTPEPDESVGRTSLPKTARRMENNR